MKPEPLFIDVVPRLLVRLPEAAKALGIAPRTLQRLLSAGEIGPQPLRIGGSTVFALVELQAWAKSVVNGRLPNRSEWATQRKLMMQGGDSHGR